MKTPSRTACTLAAIFTAHFPSHAAVTVFQDDLAGFTAVVGLLPVIDFDGVPPGTNLAGMTIRGITFTSPAGNTLNVVEAASTVSGTGFFPVEGDSDNRLFATTEANVLSTGGSALVRGNDLRERDGLRLVLPTPVRDFGIHVLFQSLDGSSFTTFELRNSAGAVIASGPVNIPMRGPATDPVSSYPEGGAVFIGFRSDQADIARIDFLETDGDANFPDSNIGYDMIRVVAAGPQTGLYAFTHISDNYFGIHGLNPAIDGSGTVVFLFDSQIVVNGLVARSSAGGPETALANFAAGYGQFFGHAVNGAGRVAFSSLRNDGVFGVFSASTGGGPITTAAGANGAFQFFGPPALNRVGQVVFEAELNPPNPAPRGIYLGNTSGGSATVLLDDSSMFNFSIGGFEKNPDINEVGTIVFFANRDAGGEGIFSISSSGGAITTVADTSGAFTFFDGPSINNAGTVAFRAGLGGAGEGVFRASSAGGPPSLVADDVLFTSTVRSVQFVKEGLNHLGQIAFYYDSPTGAPASPSPPRAASSASGRSRGPQRRRSAWPSKASQPCATRSRPRTTYASLSPSSGRGSPRRTAFSNSTRRPPPHSASTASRCRSLCPRSQEPWSRTKEH